MITSKENPHFKKLLKLHKKRERDKSGLFLVEGEREAQLAGTLEALYHCEKKPAWVTNECETLHISPELFSKVSYRDCGVIGIARKERKKLLDLKDLSLLLLVEGIEKPGNLGAMMRTCEGAGCSGLIVCDSGVDLYNPNVIRASLGSFFTLPIVEATTCEAIDFLKVRRVNLVVTTPQANQVYTEENYSRATCIVIGSEKEGVTSFMEKEANSLVNIPMLGRVDSLNASVAAAVLLYEALRQRSTLSR